MADNPSRSRSAPAGGDPVLALRFSDRYEPLVRLAEGGMAEVYVARVRGEAGFEKLVALKRMLPHLAEEPRFVDMFLDEARLAALVRSPNVVQTLDLGRGPDGSLFLVMELVHGVSVSALVKAARQRSLPVPPAAALHILAEAANGLHDAHEAKHPDGRRLELVHRDVSPQNLLVDEQGRVLVTDFGIARALERRTQSMSGEVKGKLSYFSPEQAAGEAVDRRTDIYALAVVAWELFAGRRLFEGADTAETLERLQAPLPPADELSARVDAPVVRVVYRALEREPADRFATAAAFGDALRGAALEAGILADRTAAATFVQEAAGPLLEALQARIRQARSGEGAPESVRSDAPTRPRDQLPRRKSSPDADTAVIGRPRTPDAEPAVAAEVRAEEVTTDRVEDPVGWGPSARALKGRGPGPGARRSRAGLIGLGAVVLALAAVLVWWRLSADQDTARKPPPKADVATVSGDAGARRPALRPRTPSARRVLRIGARPPRRFRSGFVAEGLYEGLLRRGPDGVWVPHVAERIPSLAGPDARLLAGGKLLVRWRLRKDVKWSDGEPLRAADLVFGLQVWAPPELEKAEAKGEHTVELVWRDRVAVAFRTLHPLPMHVLGPVYARGGSEAVLELLRLRPVPGLGPYRVTGESTVRKVVLEANPHYPGPAPAIPRVEVHLMTGSALAKRFLAGALDLTVPNSISMQQAQQIRRTRPAVVHLRPSNKQLVLQPDLRHPLLARRAVRQALLMALDRERLAREIYGRFGQVSHLPLAGVQPTGLRRYKHDPKAARRALARAGALGKKIVLLHGGRPTGRRIVAMLSADLSRVGLRVERQQWPLTERRTLFRKSNHGGLLLYSLRGLDRWPLRHWWSVPQRQGRYLTTARHAALDDWVAALMERESRALDPKKRQALRDQVWVAYSERLPHLPLVFATERILADPSLRGWDFRAGRPFGVDIAHWYFTR